MLVDSDLRMVRVGLTGGIAAGKSTVAARLGKLGALLIDYDVLARKVVAPGGEAMRRIVEAFGEQAALPDGSLNRAWMAERVFGTGADRGAVQMLNAIEHPLIYQLAQREERIMLNAQRSSAVMQTKRKAIAGTYTVVVHDVPLLAQVVNEMPFTFDCIVSVEAPEVERMRRMVVLRGASEEQARGRVRSQVGEQERKALADVIIDSTQPLEQMFECVDMLYSSWQRGDMGR